MKKATLKEVQSRLGEYVKSVSSQPVLILEGGEPVAMLVGLGRRKNRAPIKLREILRRAWKITKKMVGKVKRSFGTN